MNGYTHRIPEHVTRLRRVEGQVRGVQRLIEQDTYCIDVLTQISAAQMALKSLATELLDDHLRHCVREAVADGDANEIETKMTEAMAAVRRLTGS